jgi:phenylpyruvate tautomerase PptA (4-oxalocrotonate tautomerase family)
VYFASARRNWRLKNMPTYVCSVLENSVDERQKDAIAEAIAWVHSEETGAPKFFCQIVIDEKKPTSKGTLDIALIRSDLGQR